MKTMPSGLIGILVLVAGCVLWADVCLADSTAEIQELRRKTDEQAVLIQRQQATMQQLAAKLAALEARLEGRPLPPATTPQRVGLEQEELAALPPELVQRRIGQLPLEIGGYLDLGYVDGAGSGTVSTSALHINSRGDTLASVGLDGDSSFLINEVNLDLKAHVAEPLDAVVSLDFLPRKLSVTTSGGTAQTDSMEVDQAYLVYVPFSESNALSDALFGDLRLWLGKFESPFGIEYRVNESPDRVNITRSMMSIYWTGYPVGIKARGKLLKDRLAQWRNSALTYNLALTNAEPWISTLVDTDRADTSKRTVMGRLSYGFDVVKNVFVESGLSLAYGPRINQGDNNATAESLGLDVRLERGPLTLRAEYDYSDLDRPRTGPSSATAATFSHLYLEGFYDIRRPSWLPREIPMVSLAPYYRYDTRDLNSTPATGVATVQEIKRHTFALRYLLRPGSILKGEYYLVGEAEGASVNDDAFLMSFVQQF